MNWRFSVNRPVTLSPQRTFEGLFHSETSQMIYFSTSAFPDIGPMH